MDQHIQLMIWGAATVAPFVLNSATKRHPDALGLSAMMIMGWVCGRVCWAIWSPPEAMQFYPVIDGLSGAVAFAAYITYRSPWKLALVALFAVQCCLHVAFWAAYPATATLLRYLAINNIIYACELCLVASPGVWGVARIIGRRLSRRLDRLHHAGP